MSDTPRTDARLIEVLLPSGVIHKSEHVQASFAGQLERELAAEKQKRWSLESKLEAKYGLRRELEAELGLTSETGDEALKRGLDTIRALRQERDEARECLREAIQYRNEEMNGYDLEAWRKAAGLEDGL